MEGLKSEIKKEIINIIAAKIRYISIFLEGLENVMS
jgi:hypothetical protein